MTKPESLDLEVVCDLKMDEQELRREDAYQRDGHAARTLVRESDLRVVLIAMRPGAHIAEHVAEATVMIQVLAGQIRLHVSGSPPASDRDVQLESGHVLVLAPGVPHDVEAAVESTMLVTLGWRPKTRQHEQPQA